MAIVNMKDRHVTIDYTNHAGVRSLRRIMPDTYGLQFGSSEWHPEPQYLLTAHDFDRDDSRTFAVKDIHSWTPGKVSDVEQRMHGSMAKQLQASMERNARMVNRLKRYRELGVSTPFILDAILKDEEPTW